MEPLSSPSSVFSFIQSVDFPYFPGAIYPSEMACFLSRCEEAGIDCIIESGRADGYSTAIVAAYGKRRNIKVVSFDTEADGPRAEACRKRLSQYKEVVLIAGDAFHLIPELLRSLSVEKRTIALLIDGPKMHQAIYLSAAAVALGPVKLVAHHNTEPTTAWYRHFVQRFPGTERLEESNLFRSHEFPKFREWEKVFTRGYQSVGRDLDATSLVVSVLPSCGPDRIYLQGPSLRHTLNATLLYWWWRLDTPWWPVIQFLLRVKNSVKARLRIS